MVFTQILKKTLTFEGGWSNHPNDKGGATQFGVTQNTLDAYLAQKHQNSSNTYQDFPQRVSELTEAEASFIYQHIVAYNHTQQVCQRGWQRRANAFRFSQGNQYEVAS